MFAVIAQPISWQACSHLSFSCADVRYWTNGRNRHLLVWPNRLLGRFVRGDGRVLLVIVIATPQLKVRLSEVK